VLPVLEEEEVTGSYRECGENSEMIGWIESSRERQGKSAVRSGYDQIENVMFVAGRKS